MKKIKIVLFTLLLAVSCLVAAGEKKFLPLSELSPGQPRFSSKNVDIQIRKILKARGVEWDLESNVWQGVHNKKTSTYPLSEAFPVIKGPLGYVLVHGHHHLMASKTFGATTFPVEILADLSILPEVDFWKVAELNSWAYPVDTNGAFMPPPREFEAMEDDPLRYFVILVTSKKNSDGTRRSPTGTDYPILLKDDHLPLFAELRMTDILRKNNFKYTYEMGNYLSDSLVEKARVILAREPIPGVNLVTKRKHYSEFGGQADVND